ncbi:MAG: glycosyltransferase family 4 protein [Euryarchaeota archaeon]|nr:glycosyltransferase family 4 protein [Euryarchaeota archaeon]
MKRLCVVADTYPPKKDGVVTFLRHVLPELGRHYHVTLVAPRFSRSRSFGGAEVVLSSCIPVELASYAPAIPSARLARAIRRCDMVLVNDLAPLGSAAITLARAMHKPVAVFCHHDEATMLEKAFRLDQRRLVPERRIRGFVNSVVKQHYRRADLFFVATSRFRQKLLSLGIPESRVVFAPFGVDTARFRRVKSSVRERLGIPEDAPVVLYLGRMSHEKNVETLIRAIPLITSRVPETHFIFAGGGAALEEYRRLAEGLAHGRVHFTGWVEWEHTPEYYSAADVFVHPSLHESQSMSVMEAMACGCAVVVSRDSGGESYLKHGHNCVFLWNPTSPAELSERVVELLSEPELRHRLGENARKSMQRYSWDAHISALLEGLRRIEGSAGRVQAASSQPLHHHNPAATADSGQR